MYPGCIVINMRLRKQMNNSIARLGRSSRKFTHLLAKKALLIFFIYKKEVILKNFIPIGFTDTDTTNSELLKNRLKRVIKTKRGLKKRRSKFKVEYLPHLLYSHPHPKRLSRLWSPLKKHQVGRNFRVKMKPFYRCIRTNNFFSG